MSRGRWTRMITSFAQCEAHGILISSSLRYDTIYSCRPMHNYLPKSVKIAAACASLTEVPTVSGEILSGPKRCPSQGCVCICITSSILDIIAGYDVPCIFSTKKGAKVVGQQFRAKINWLSLLITSALCSFMIVHLSVGVWQGANRLRLQPAFLWRRATSRSTR
jgi:hypothetical protein